MTKDVILAFLQGFKTIIGICAGIGAVAFVTFTLLTIGFIAGSYVFRLAVMLGG